MLSRLLKWIGWETRQAPARKPTRPFNARSATAHLFEKRPPAGQQKPAKPGAADENFNPYNTGKFDRSASWERISKNQR
jgi:hypothetical protein